MVFPKSNLATASQPWGRFVEKSITALETITATDRVNNAARDAQAALNIKRLDASLAQVASLGLQTAQNVADIQTITDSVFTLNTDVSSLESNVYYTGTTEINGYNIRAGTINANAINAGTLTGFTIQTASSGTRVVMGGSTIQFYYGSTPVGTLSGTGVYGNETSLLYPGTSIGIYVTSSSARLDATNSYVQASTASARITGGGSHVITDSSGVSLIGTLYANSISASGSYTGSGNIRAPGITATGFMQSENYAGGGTTSANINNNGTIVRGPSSQRYKQDIEDAIYPYEDVLSLQPKSFRLKDEVLESENARRYAGFIAEEIAGTSLDVFVAYQPLPDGTKRPDGVYYAELTSALVSAIKHQDNLIKNLTSRIEILEGN